MINIAVCDDQPIHLRKIMKMVRDTCLYKIPEKMDCRSYDGFYSAEKVISFLKTNKIDILFLDIEMEGMNGFELAGLLKKEFPGVTLIDNPYFDTCNNIASLYVARDHLENCMILDGDQIIFEPSVLAPEFERSGYNAVWTEEETTEWLMTVEDGIVTGCSRTGGKRGWQLYSISRWSAEDGARLRGHLELEFEERGNRQIYWDDVAMFCHFDEYRLGIRPMRESDCLEIDSLEELKAADPSYR